ncbi:hypothetical protein SBOR_2588 [Sclerotinia borealis F-4128]|uniref:Uncharacterized protein n=1 Tax=Sclerotinia borealis (strain F-4128) TaxID=1432307 RepID=W9CLY1_SCLBF|nr:hypothetical protein SBOR_2588 [Sclerotinia borealis F-4128]
MPSIPTILYRSPARLRASILIPQCRQAVSTRPFSSSLSRASTQGYGDGEGSPVSENPQDQGASNATKHNAEHPGPEPVSEGQGTGAGPTKGGSKGPKSPEDASAQSGGSRSMEAKETGSSPTGGSIKGSGGKKKNLKEKSVNGASPKIHSEDKPPGPDSASKQAEVEKHNREFREGHDGGSQKAE